MTAEPDSFENFDDFQPVRGQLLYGQLLRGLRAGRAQPGFGW